MSERYAAYLTHTDPGDTDDALVYDGYVPQIVEIHADVWRAVGVVTVTAPDRAALVERWRRSVADYLYWREDWTL